MSLNVALRCDASTEIGTGHVMRCLTLALGLRAAGHRCTFIARDLPGGLGERITAEGFALVRLPTPDAAFVPEGAAPAHAGWAGVPWQRDAAETRAVLEAGYDWVVLDHYAFDIKWQSIAVPPAARLAVIDDLADRVHRCDLLLDQNLGRKAADYDRLVPVLAERLIGPDYALLRPGFAGLRDAALAARAARGGALCHILIALGGVDQPGVSRLLLRALAGLPLPVGVRIDVVMGPASPSLDRVRAEAARMPVPCRVLVDVVDMAGLMASADLAIGGVGGTAWERCARGLPSLFVVMADNQAAGAAALVAAGAGLMLGVAGAKGLAGRLAEALAMLSEPAALQAMSARAAAVTGGRGTGAMVAAICAPALHLRAAAMADAPLVWQWRAIADANALKSGVKSSLAAHCAWFEAALQAPGMRLYMACTDHPVGHLRLDDSERVGTATVSLLLGAGVAGRGVGRRILALATAEARRIGLRQLLAEIHPGNAASLRVFAAAGFRDAPPVAGFARLILTL